MVHIAASTGCRGAYTRHSPLGTLDVDKCHLLIWMRITDSFLQHQSLAGKVENIWSSDI